MVFQNYALYPHMSVYDNMAFGLENAKVPRAQIESKIQAAAAMLRLDNLLQRRPTQLSGGQRQRVAIGRAIVREPKIFLFDEPLSNLDAELRVSMRAELRELHDRLGSTMIYVTHDQVEAMTMADQIVVLRAGRIEQVGSPQELYERPCNTFVAGFIGSPRMNFLPLAALPPGSALGQGLRPGTTQMGVRPEHWQLTGASGSGSNGLPLTVLNAEYLGAQRLVRASLNASASSASVTLEILIPGEVPLSPGGQLTVWAEPAHVHAFNDAGLRLPGTAT